MTDKAHTHNISPSSDVSEGGIATGNMHAILRMIEERILMGGEEAAELALRFASPHTNFGKSLRDTRAHNFNARTKNVKNLQEQETHDQPTPRTPEQRDAAINRIADKIFARRRARANP